jgi:hypothetical protein
MWHELPAYAVAVAVLLGIACTGQPEAAAQVPPEPRAAPRARFVGIFDAVPSRYFDARTSAPDPGDANSLVFGFDKGSDPTTLVARDFRASALPFSHRTAMDTISFTIEAPAGYFVSKVVYGQQGTASTGRTSIVAGGATWVVAGIPGNLGSFSDDPSLSSTLDLTSLRLTSVPVSITVSLFASTGTVAVTGAGVRVELLPL